MMPPLHEFWWGKGSLYPPLKGKRPELLGADTYLCEPRLIDQIEAPKQDM